MLESMRKLAVAHLYAQLGGEAEDDLDTWYRKIRENNPGALFPFLVEDVSDESSATERSCYYTLKADPVDPEVAVLEPRELTAEDAARLPFNQPSGPRSPALGPVIKRKAPSGKDPLAPKPVTQKTTLDRFAEIAGEGMPWSAYFGKVHDCWVRPKLRFHGQTIDAKRNAYQEAIERIDARGTVLLAFRNADGHLPGQVREYVKYLQLVLANAKYASGSHHPRSGTCSLCDAVTTVYPRAPYGAGLNIANLDRDGAFPGLDPCAAVDTFGLCLACADLLYVYCRHVSGKFRAPIAGEQALILPTLGPDCQTHPKFLRMVEEWVRQASQGKGLVPMERQLLKKMANEDKVITTIDIIWAEFGQRIEGVCGVITDILPSRLKEIATVNDEIGKVASHLFPEGALDDFTYDVSLSILKPLLNRPGGKAAQRSNESRRLWEVRRELAEAIYHKRSLPARFWPEVMTTARWHWDAAAASDAPVYMLTREGESEKKGTTFLTVAGWVKQLARFLHYLKLVGVDMPEEAPPYQPGVEWLKPYFGPESGLNNSKAKAFAFLLGALYGKLLTIQGRRGVNVGANALTWLRRLSLNGADLPELYIKVRGKMLEYAAERNPRIRELNAELGELGCRLGNEIALDETDTCYFLLLGQSLAVKMMPPKKKEVKSP